MKNYGHTILKALTKNGGAMDYSLKKNLLLLVFTLQTSYLSFGNDFWGNLDLNDLITLNNIYFHRAMSPNRHLDFRAGLESKIVNNRFFLHEIKKFCGVISYDKFQFATWIIRENITPEEYAYKYYLVTSTIPDGQIDTQKIAKIYDHNKSIMKKYRAFTLQNIDRKDHRHHVFIDKREVTYQDHESTPILIESIHEHIIKANTRLNRFDFRSFWKDIEQTDFDTLGLEEVKAPYFLRWRNKNSRPIKGTANNPIR